MNVILTHLGSKFPAYYKFCIEQFRIFNPEVKVYFIGQKKHLRSERPFFLTHNIIPIAAEDLQSDARIQKFRNKHWFKKWGTPETNYPSPPDFWRYTTERLFYVECLMRCEGLTDVFHFENDVLIYRNLEEIKKGIDRIGAPFMVTPVGCHWDSFALIFMKHSEALAGCCDFILAHTSKTEDEIHKLYGIDSVNDMTLLKIFSGKNRVGYFPVLPEGKHSENFKIFESIFDGASWGQFMGGTNNGHPKGWAWENHDVGAELVAGNYDLIWEIVDGLRIPFASGKGKKIRINNLHIHSKQLELYLSKAKIPESEKLLQEVLESFEISWRATHSRGDTLTGEQQLKRDKPRPFILKAIELFKTRGGKRIVEIGTSGSPLSHSIDEDASKWGEHCCNSGHSTFLLALSEAEEVHTVDISPDATQAARRNLEKHPLTKNLKNVRFITQDALQFLKDFNKPIDLLYLDGWDVQPYQYAENHLAAYLLARKNLHANSLILIDDTDVDRGGKGRRVVPQALKDGYRVVFEGRQTLLIHTSSKLDLDLTRALDFKFEYDTNAYATHQPVLYEVIKRTTGPILELGCGTGSTSLIHHFALGRQVLSVEDNADFLSPLKALYEDKNHQFLQVSSWSEVLSNPIFHQKWSLIFIDQSPFEARYESLMKLKSLAEYVIIHDSDYFPAHKIFGSQKRLILPFLDEGSRNYDDVFRYWKEFFPKKPWVVETGPPTLVGSDSKPCDFNVSFDI